MIYTSSSHIISIHDVETFFSHLRDDWKLSFHPDDDFVDYINFETEEPSFAKEEASLFNRLMDEAFKVCEDADADIYGIGMTILNKAIGVTLS